MCGKIAVNNSMRVIFIAVIQGGEEFSTHGWYERNHAGKIIFSPMIFPPMLPQLGVKELCIVNSLQPAT